MSKKVTFIITVLNSQEIVNRQLIYYNKNNLIPDDWEFIIVDDGSDTPIELPNDIGYDLKLIKTNNKRKWSQNIARNHAAKVAKGKYLLMTDIDKIFTKSGIDACKEFKGDRLDFVRSKGWINKNYDLEYGLSFLKKLNVREYKGKRSVHSNTFLIKKSIYLDKMNGGYHYEYCNRNFYTNDDLEFNTRYQVLVRDKKVNQIIIAKLRNEPHIVCLCNTHPEYAKYFHTLKRDKRKEECLSFIRKINGTVYINGKFT